MAELTHVACPGGNAFCGQPLYDERGRQIDGMLAYDTVSLPHPISDAVAQGWCPDCIATLTSGSPSHDDDAPT